jgi:protein-tyrosine phosphatase
MNWITSSLAIGDLDDANSTAGYIRRNVHLKIDVRDAFSDEEPIPEKINDLVDLIQENIDNGLRVMIYCQAGMDRSPFVAASYLVKTENLSYADAYTFVQKERPQTITHFEWAEVMAEKPVEPVELKLKPKGKKVKLDLGENVDVEDTQ